MTYRTLGAPVVLEIPKIKGSRFLAHAVRVGDDEDVAAALDAIRREHHSARHVCWARVLGDDGADARTRDDGEPSGSAGRPILAAIQGRDLTRVLVAVVRWFGGTKLGVGGLARAYGGAAAAALDAASIVEVLPVRAVSVELGYDRVDAVRAVAARAGRLERDAEYGARVRLTWEVPADDAEAWAAALVDATDGRGRTTVGPVQTSERACG